jgi:hypothetical protein
MPKHLDSMMQLEIDIEMSEIAHRLRQRLADLSVKEWPVIDRNIYNDSDDLNLRNE